MSDQIEAAGALVIAGMAANALDHPAGGKHNPVVTCANCGTALAGPFCSQCGQRAHLHRTVGDVFHEFLHGITHFDGKAWTTLPMLVFRPGKLIRSYIDGHRARYVAPVPLFLMIIFLMFFVLSFVSFDEKGVDVSLKTDASSASQPQLGTSIAEIDREIAAARAGGDTDELTALEATRSLLTGIELGRLAKSGETGSASDRAGIAKALAELDRGIAAAKAAGNTKKLAELESGRRLIAAVGVPTADASFTDRMTDAISAAVASGEMKANSGSAWFDAKVMKALKNPKLALYKLQSKAYKLSFLLVPLSLPWLWIVFVWRRGVGMYDHAIFTLYSISFMSLLFVAGSLLLAADVTTEYVWLPVLLVPAAHLFASLRGAYALGAWSAGWRTAYLSAAAVMTLSAYFIILIVAGVLD